MKNWIALTLLALILSISAQAKTKIQTDWIPAYQTFKMEILDYHINKELLIRGIGNNPLIFKSKNKLTFDFSECSPDNYIVLDQKYQNKHYISKIQMVVTSDMGGCPFTINNNITVNYFYVTDY